MAEVYDSCVRLVCEVEKGEFNWTPIHGFIKVEKGEFSWTPLNFIDQIM